MQQLQTIQNNSVIDYNQEQIELIKSTIAVGATNLELQMFLQQCKRTGLDAITRQIYFIKNPKDGKVQVQTSIDGFRLIASRSGDYEGQTKPEWCGEDGVWKDVWLSKDVLPSAARIGVWKRGFREALYGVALFEEYAQRKSGGELTYMWNKMAALMISKVAESLALRKAFPNEMSGIYTQEEMAQSTVAEEEKKVKTIAMPTMIGGGALSRPAQPAAPYSEADLRKEYLNQPSVNAEFDPPQSENPAPQYEQHTTAAAPQALSITPEQVEAYRVKFTKNNKGKSFDEMGRDDVSGLMMWLENKAADEGKPLTGMFLEFVQLGNEYLKLTRK